MVGVNFCSNSGHEFSCSVLYGQSPLAQSSIRSFSTPPPFFGGSVSGVGAGTIPIALYLNQRFAKPGWLERDALRVERQGAWVGMFGAVVAYLQLIRALTLTIALVLAGVIVLIEMFFLTRE